MELPRCHRVARTVTFIEMLVGVNAKERLDQSKNGTGDVSRFCFGRQVCIFTPIRGQLAQMLILP